MVRVKQINIVRIKDILHRATKWRNIVLKAFPVTFTCFKASVLLPKHRGFIRCKVVSSSVTEVMLRLYLIFTPQTLS